MRNSRIFPPQCQHIPNCARWSRAICNLFRRYTMKKHRSVLLVSLLTVVSVILTAAPMASAQSANPSFSGQAVGVKATLLGLPIDLSDTGPLPPGGGAKHVSLLSA